MAYNRPKNTHHAKPKRAKKGKLGRNKGVKQARTMTIVKGTR